MVYRLLPKIVGRRGTCLIGIADVYILGGLSQYFQPPRAQPTIDQMRYLYTVAPARVWAVIWFAVGLFALVGAFWPKVRSAAFAAVLALLGAWTIGVCAAAVGGAYRGWLSVAVYSGLLILFQTIAGWHDGDHWKPHLPAGRRRRR